MLGTCLAPNAAPIEDIDPGRLEQSTLVDIGTREWNGMSVRVQESNGSTPLSRPLMADAATLLVVLEEVGGHAEVRAHPNQSPSPAYWGKDHISFIPAGMRAWQNTRDVRYLRQVVIRFYSDSVQSDCRLMFSNRRVWMLASLLASEALAEAPLDAAYGESLGAAILTSLLAATEDKCAQSGLTQHQLRRLADYVRAKSFAKIRVRELAALLGSSQSHFSRSFKTSTGLSPHRWLLDLRVAESQRLLLDTPMSLTEIALALGFCEQCHFTRTFGAIVGISPSAWRRSHKG
jgi:AraC-like DNA-binding protein